jgi:hypothetical protein
MSRTVRQSKASLPGSFGSRGEPQLEEPVTHERPTVLYLGGFGRSGTTLLARSLGGLPGAVSVGELVHLWERGVRADERCGCGAPFSQCEFWREVGGKAFGGWSSLDIEHVVALKRRVDRNRFIPMLAAPSPPRRFRADLDEYADLLTKVYSAVREVSGAQVIVDSSKHPSTAFLLARVDAVDLRVVHVVRDSRGVAYSWLKQVRRPEATGAGAPALMPTYSPARSALLWDAHNALFSVLRTRPLPSTRVRYEDLLANTHGELGRVAAFAGLTRAELSAAHLGPGWVDLSVGHTVAGNPMRFRTGRLRLRADEQWREGLSRARQRQIAALTAPLRLSYGYRSSVRGGAQ